MPDSYSGVGAGKGGHMLILPTIDTVKTGQNISSLRRKKGMAVRDVQDVFGFATPQAIYKWQHGSTLPTVDNLVVLASLFDVSIDDIIVTKSKE